MADTGLVHATIDPDDMSTLTVWRSESGDQVHVQVTSEGLIVDLYDDQGELFGTNCHTFDELIELYAPPVSRFFA